MKYHDMSDVVLAENITKYENLIKTAYKQIAIIDNILSVRGVAKKKLRASHPNMRLVSTDSKFVGKS